MNINPLGQPQQNPFGTVADAPVDAAADPVATASSSSRTLLIAGVSGTVALLALGAVAWFTLGGSPEAPVAAQIAPVSTQAPASEPSSEPTAAPASPLPTAAVQARNIFVPLVNEESETAAVDLAAGGTVAAPAASTAPVSVPTAAVPAPTVTEFVTETVKVPGPTVKVPGPTVTVSGPTSTATVTTPPRTVPGPTTTVSPYRYEVVVVSVVDDASATTGARFTVNGTVYNVADEQSFADVFKYSGYDVAGDSVMLYFGSSLFSLPVGSSLGFGTT